MEIHLYTKDGEYSVSIHGSMYAEFYRSEGSWLDLPPPPAGYFDTPAARVLFHAFSEKELPSWKKCIPASK